MVRAPDWTPGEFAVLVSSPRMTKDEVASQIGTRSDGAVDVVRQGVCLFHRDQDMHGILSQLMIEFLSARRGHDDLTCAECKASF